MKDIEHDVLKTGGTGEFEEIKKMISETGEQDENDKHSHSHHHHSHGHHHKHHHRHHQTKWSKFKTYIKQNKKKVQVTCICTVIFVLFFVGIFVWGLSQQSKSSPEEVQMSSDDAGQKKTSSIIIETTFFDDDVTLVTAPVVEYMHAGINVLAKDIYIKHKESERIDQGLPVSISFDVRGLSKKVMVESSELHIAEDAALTNPTVYSFESDEGKVSIQHLKTNTQYYYRVQFVLSNGTTASTQGSFRTADTPRILSIDGIANVRDIGGWNTTNGKCIKQGLLYRGSELDGAVENKFLLTADGMQDMLTVLGIRTDMDLRASTDNQYGTDALGESVTHIYYNVPMYMGVFADGNKAAVRKLFSDLANRNNYPVYLHCTYGLDRTGTMCYLLEALLGVSDEDLLRDYQLSALYYGKVADEEMAKFVNQLETYAGSTTQQKVENYLLSIGVTPEEIQSIRDIFLGE